MFVVAAATTSLTTARRLPAPCTCVCVHIFTYVRHEDTYTHEHVFYPYIYTYICITTKPCRNSDPAGAAQQKNKTYMTQ